MSEKHESVAPQPPPHHPAKDTWSPEEMARKQNIVHGSGMELTPAAQRAIRCAECILARPVFHEDNPTFTAREVSNCTGLAPSGVWRTLSWPVHLRLATREEAPPTMLSGFPHPLIYRPVTREDGAQFFIPSRRPDCNRTWGKNLVEGLKQPQYKVLNYLARLSGESTTRAQVRDYTGLCDQTMEQLLQRFCRAEIVAMSEKQEAGVNNRQATRYTLTERGVWVLRQIPLLTEEEVPSADIHPLLLQKVREFYPAERYDALLAIITQHMELGVLRCGNSADTESEAARLQFTPLAHNILGRKGELAIACYLDIYRLLYNKKQPTYTDIRRIAELPERVELSSSFIAKRYYRPLLQLLNREANPVTNHTL